MATLYFKNNHLKRLSLLLALAGPGFAFLPTTSPPAATVAAVQTDSITKAMATSSSSDARTFPSYLVDSTARDDHYGTNVAQYLVDLHDNKATFDFCGGMMFQLVLSDTLRQHLGTVAAASKTESEGQPTIFDANRMRMFRIPNYSQSAEADNVAVFHGREVRNVPDAAGGMGFVLHLSMANANDPEGWSPSEIAEYNGWMHDTGRKWRKAADWKTEGFSNVMDKFGPQSFGLHHRCYWHLDGQNRVWLSAEDGCEGTPALSGGGGLASFAKMLGLS